MKEIRVEVRTSLPPLFDGTHSSAAIIAAMPSAYPSDVLTDSAKADLQNTQSEIFLKLQANDAYRGWTPTMKIQMIQCATDDVIPSANAENAHNAFNSLQVPAVLYVDPVAIANLSGEIHARAFPTALIRGLRVIVEGN